MTVRHAGQPDGPGRGQRQRHPRKPCQRHCRGDESTVNKYVAISGTFKNFGCVAATAPGSGQSVTCTLRVNGSSASVTCTISNSATSCTDVTHTATISAGQAGDYQIVTSNGASATRVFPYIEFDNP